MWAKNARRRRIVAIAASPALSKAHCQVFRDAADKSRNGGDAPLRHETLSHVTERYSRHKDAI
jgi:hypothetical protein